MREEVANTLLLECKVRVRDHMDDTEVIDELLHGDLSLKRLATGEDFRRDWQKY